MRKAQAEGVGAFANAISLNQFLGVFANVWRCLHECVFIKVAGGGPQTGEIWLRYHTSSGRNWIATRCPLIADLGMATWLRTREVMSCPLGASQRDRWIL